MSVKSFLEDVKFDSNKIQTNVILETPSCKEIRIVFPKGQVMKRHFSPYPIIIYVVKGLVELGLEETIFSMSGGYIIALEAGMIHNLVAKEDTLIRLTLSKQDKIKRVDKVAKF